MVVHVVELQYQTTTPAYLKFFNKIPMTKEEEELINYDRYMRRATLFSIACQGDLLLALNKRVKNANEYFKIKFEKTQTENKKLVS